MQFVTLGKSELKSSRIGFGCWAIGGTDWGPVDDDESMRAIRRALDLGVNFFDTADVYGDGHSEEILGRALAGERNRVLLATKVGGVRRKGEPPKHDTGYRHIMEAIDLSLGRLGTDHVDLYQVHVPDPTTPVSETMHALTELLRKGKVRYVGLSNMSVKQTTEYMQHGPITTMQPGYSMIERQPEREL
ncbi:MAG: aldo/keto reductase, partial [Candidatus Eisenbacteria bacterium]|nr:aldo/keto reductase [Candidatus Eisenbacteria bacterium]